MSVKHMALVFECLHVKPATKLVALVLADHANADGICWPSYRRIAEVTDMDKRTIQRHVKELIDLGVVTKLRTGHIVTNGKSVTRVSNAYHVSAERLQELAAELSTDGLWMGGSVDHLEVDKNAPSRVGGLSTKPLYNHQSNRQESELVDKSESLLSLADIIQQAGERSA